MTDAEFDACAHDWVSAWCPDDWGVQYQRTVTTIPTVSKLAWL